jgi:hypothetical protein
LSKRKDWILYRIEDLRPGSEVWWYFSEYIGYYDEMPYIKYDFHSYREFGGYPDVSWDILMRENSLFARRIRELARLYGYIE